jgi:hypothetical protein
MTTRGMRKGNVRDKREDDGEGSVKGNVRHKREDDGWGKASALSPIRQDVASRTSSKRPRESG